MIITKKRVLFTVLWLVILSFSVGTTVPFTLNHAWNNGHYDDARDILVANIILNWTLFLSIALPMLGVLSNRIQNRISIYQENETIARTIFDDSIANNTPNFTLAHLAGTYDYFGRDGWGTTGIWLILEELNNKKLVKIIRPKKMKRHLDLCQKNQW